MKDMKTMGRFFVSQAVLLCLAALLTSCGQSEDNQTVDTVSEEENSTSMFAMNTYVTVTAYGNDTEAALSSAEEKIRSLESLWSVTDENSEIYAVNHSGGNPVEVSDETAQLLDFSLQMNERTNGAFDISLYPVLTAWGFTTEEYRVPDDDEITQLLERTGVEKISLDGQTVHVPDDMQIDLGAIGKGYAGDLVAEDLKQNGVKSALIDLGGNIQTVGTKPGGESWSIGIRNPFGEGNFGVLEIGECAVVTSGGYERYFVEDGNTYWHILDPETGKPAQSGIISVLVIGAEGRLCDALSTSLFVMGLDRAANLWRNSDDFEMIIVTSDGGIYVTEGIEDDFTLSENFSQPEVSVIRR